MTHCCTPSLVCYGDSRTMRGLNDLFPCSGCTDPLSAAPGQPRPSTQAPLPRTHGPCPQLADSHLRFRVHPGSPFLTPLSGPPLLTPEMGQLGPFLTVSFRECLWI